MQNPQHIPPGVGHAFRLTQHGGHWRLTDHDRYVASFIEKREAHRCVRALVAREAAAGRHATVSIHPEFGTAH